MKFFCFLCYFIWFFMIITLVSSKKNFLRGRHSSRFKAKNKFLTILVHLYHEIYVEYLFFEESHTNEYSNYMKY